MAVIRWGWCEVCRRDGDVVVRLAPAGPGRPALGTCERCGGDPFWTAYPRRTTATRRDIAASAMAPAHAR